MRIGVAIVVGLMVVYSVLLAGQIFDFEGCDGCKGESQEITHVDKLADLSKQ